MRVEKIGNATLYLGDCMDILPTLPKVDAVITDPPYGTGGWRREKSGAGRNPSGGLIREDWDSGDIAWLEAGDWPILSFWPAARMPQLMAALGNRTKVRMLYMRKLDPKPQVQGRIGWSVEPIVCASKEGFQLYGGTDWVEASTPRMNRDSDATGHPYQKPITVMIWMVRKTRAEVICDPFAGSGTTGVASIQLGRNFIGIEREPTYFEIACRRIEEAQKQATLFPHEDHRPQTQMELE